MSSDQALDVLLLLLGGCFVIMILIALAAAFAPDPLRKDVRHD